MALSALLALPALADPLDPTSPPKLSVGTPAGRSPMHRQGGGRLGFSSSSLPRVPRIAWQLRLGGDPVGAPAVDEGGRVIVATRDQKLTQIGASGALEWQVELPSPPGAGPVLTSGGLRVVACEDGAVLAVSPSGRVTRRTELGVTGPLRAELLPTDDGEILLATGAELVRLGPLGAIQLRTLAPAPIAALTCFGSETLVATATGQVLRLHPLGQLLRAGDLGAPLTGPFLQGTSGRVAGVVQGARVVELDLRRGTRRTLADLGPEGVLAVAATPDVSVLLSVTRGGQLLRHEGLRTAPLEGALLLTPGRPENPDPALLALDASGAAAALGREALLVTAAGEPHVLPLGGCEPVALSPAGHLRLVISCRGGQVLGISGGANE